MSAKLNVPDGGAGPVIVLSYLHSGAQFVQDALAEDTELVCTAGTGILLQCQTAAAAWARISNHTDDTMSPLAMSSIRALVSTQLTVILADAGRPRWCELVIASPSAVQTFLQVVPSARCVCVHRACSEVVSAAIAAHPWGLASPALARFVIRYPGNSVAAAAAYWLFATERLLAFEARHPRSAVRVRYEDVVADEHELDIVRSALDLNRHTIPRVAQTVPRRLNPAGTEQDAEALQLPADMIPDELRKRIDSLHAQLGYPASPHGKPP